MSQLIITKLKPTIVVLSLALLLGLNGLTVSAQTLQEGSVLDNTRKAGLGAGYDTASPKTGLAEIAGSIVATFLSIVGVLFISYIVYGGFLWMTAAGNEEKVTKAKDIIRNGIIGLIVIFSAAAIYYFVITIFDITGTSSAPTITAI